MVFAIILVVDARIAKRKRFSEDVENYFQRRNTVWKKNCVDVV